MSSRITEGINTVMIFNEGHPLESRRRFEDCRVDSKAIGIISE
jgi:hypothetical protein